MGAQWDLNLGDYVTILKSPMAPKLHIWWLRVIILYSTMLYAAIIDWVIVAS